jgi:valyl-tRNA synthetase
VVVPLEGLVDLDEEIKRIQKAIEKLEKDLGMLSRRLEDGNFVKNAPEEVVVQGRKQLDETKSQIGTLRVQLSRLQS